MDITPTTVLEQCIAKICEILAEQVLFADLKLYHDIYPVCIIQPYEGMSQWALQVSDGSSSVAFPDREGGVSREQQQFSIAVLARIPKDFSMPQSEMMINHHRGFLQRREAIKTALNGNFLLTATGDELLVRPLVYVGSSKTYATRDLPEILIKELTFIGGINDRI